MNYSLYRVNTFFDNFFHGNPACVIPLRTWFSDDVLLKIAQKNNVAETAFFINNGNSVKLRWFTPDLEMDLCGHATLAAACVLKSILNYPLDIIRFNTLSGELMVSFENSFYFLNFPSRPPKTVLLPKLIESSLNIQPKAVFKSNRDYMLIYSNQQEIKNIQINRKIFDKIDLGCGGVIVTAQGDSVDFVSRFFTPQATILEDPVTGSTHCTLIPFWSSKLSKQKLEALQLSKRGGRLICKNLSGRVLIGGAGRVFATEDLVF